MAKNKNMPSGKAVAEMMHRMHTDAARSESKAGWHASSAKHEQLAAKYRNAANKD